MSIQMHPKMNGIVKTVKLSLVAVNSIYCSILLYCSIAANVSVLGEAAVVRDPPALRIYSSLSLFLSLNPCSFPAVLPSTCYPKLSSPLYHSQQ
jgi:hypothetical protein